MPQRPLARRPRARNERGQTIALGAITLLILALVTFITLNVTLSIHQKIKLQNYADAKAFSLAVQEARALNYFAYTNRAIASAYVSMANMHAYMSEASMLATANSAAAFAMTAVSAMEYAQCMCGWVPCRPQHCAHGLEANLISVMFGINHVSGEFGDAIQELDDPFRNTMSALNTHIGAIRLSQQDVRLNFNAHLAAGGELARLKEMNVGQAPVNDGTASSAATAVEFEDIFYSEEEEKKRIMAEVANASRPGFTWNRSGALLADPVLFLPAMQQRLRETSNNRGTWTVVQAPVGIGTGSAGRAGFTQGGEFPGEALGAVALARDPEPGGVTGETLSSYDFGALAVVWRHGAGGAQLPFLLWSAGPGHIVTGENNNLHRSNNVANFFNEVHDGANHDLELDLSRFMEFDIGEEAPFNQPAVYATASTETRVNERGERMVFEVTDSGRVTFDVGGAGTGSVQLSNEGTAHAASKALVYYHRIGDWSDYPNLFNPYWRAKLEPMTTAEAAAVIGAQDATSAGVVTTVSALPGGRGAVNLQ